MSIVKRVPDNTGFTMVSNQVLQHETMSLVARGLLAHLLSMPPDWKINVTHLLGQFSERRPCVHRAWQELKELGYVRKIQLRENGRIAGWDYEVSQDPEKQEASISTTLKNKNLANKNLANNNLANNNLATEGHIKKEETKQTKNKETEYPLTPRGGNQTAEPLASDLNPEEKKPRIRVGNLELPSWLSKESWQDFVEHRKALRKPMTPKAGELILGKLKTIAKEHGEQAAQESLLNSIAAGWQGVFPPKDAAPTAPTSAGGYMPVNDKNHNLINSWLEEENGNETNDRQSAANMGGQHRTSDSDRSAGSLAADVSGSSGRAVCGGAEKTPSRDAGTAVSDSWTDLGIAAELTSEHGVFFSN